MKRLDRMTPSQERELFKRSPAMAVANRILSGMRHKEEPSLADLFIANTYSDGSQFTGKVRKIVEEAMLRYRLDMRKAHRFVLDNQFVEMATHIATAPAEKILARIQYATLPYDTTWIEFNLPVKVRTIRRIHNDDNKDMSQIAPRMGMLLQRINDTDALCTCVSEIEGIATPHMTSYFFSTMETDFADRDRIYFGAQPIVIYVQEGVASQDQPFEPITKEHLREAMHNDSIGKASMWGYSQTLSGMMPSDAVKSAELHTPSFLQRHGDVGLSRMYYGYKEVFKQKHKMEQLNDLVMAELKEFSGHMRWLVTVLAMLNEVPVNTHTTTRDIYMRVGRFRKHKFLDYHKVTLKLPKKNPINYYEKYLRGQSDRRNRAHEVRSHWRTYLNQPHCKYEEHNWVYDNDEGYRLCGKCMGYSRLIHEHIRGDQSLGWVRKDYVIKKAT